MPNKPQERFCVREFRRYLLRSSPGSKVRWIAEPNDPPDFWLWRDGQKYAVEVTSVLHEGDQTLTESQSRLADRATRHALEAGVLSGTYALAFRAGLDGRGQRREFVKQVLEYVRRTAREAQTYAESVVVSGRLVCDIHKCSAESKGIYFCGGGEDLGGFEPDVRAELGKLLALAICRKAQSMAKIPCRAALVLYDLYRLATPSIFSECVRAVHASQVFAYIYVVQNPGVGYAALAPRGTKQML